MLPVYKNPQGWQNQHNILVSCWTTKKCQNSLSVPCHRFYKSLVLHWTTPTKCPDHNRATRPLTIKCTLQSVGKQLSETRSRRSSDSHCCWIWGRKLWRKFLIIITVSEKSGTSGNIEHVHQSENVGQNLRGEKYQLRKCRVYVVNDKHKIMYM